MTAPTIGNGESWQNQEEVTISSIMSSAEDGSGGIAEVMLNYSDTWTSIDDETFTLSLNDGKQFLDSNQSIMLGIKEKRFRLL